MQILLYDECPDDNPMKEDLKMIVEQGDRAKKIVSGLLNFSRKNKVNLQPTDITELIDRSLNGIIKQENITININHKNKTNIADIDPDQMIQVILNLVTNAIEAMPDGGVINITTDKKENNSRIVIRDSGTGIDEKKREKVFEPFFTTKQMGKGTGLGLAVSYGIIKMHKGILSVTSNSDKEKGLTYAEFTVSIPVITENKEEELNGKKDNPYS